MDKKFLLKKELRSITAGNRYLDFNLGMRSKCKTILLLFVLGLLITDRGWRTAIAKYLLVSFQRKKLQVLFW